MVRRGLENNLPPGYDIDTHFTPRYNPWDQRLCLVPDGDLFEALAEGRASVVTDGIDSFTENGVRLASGGELEADLIVTATGLNMLALGGTELVVDGQAVELPKTMTYRGMMLSDVPNMAFVLGYTNASWTLKADLVSSWFAGLVTEMDRRRAHRFVVAEPEVPGARPLMDMKSGYLLRGAGSMPRQGDSFPFEAKQNYLVDKKLLGPDTYDDGYLRFG
jgi:cation diffusion facilitator CzcD-associated flavoprotein CzcO